MPNTKDDHDIFTGNSGYSAERTAGGRDGEGPGSPERLREMACWAAKSHGEREAQASQCCGRIEGLRSSQYCKAKAGWPAVIWPLTPFLISSSVLFPPLSCSHAGLLALPPKPLAGSRPKTSSSAVLFTWNAFPGPWPGQWPHCSQTFAHTSPPSRGLS